MKNPATERRTRKDAQHNRTHILEVARQAFTSARGDVSMDGIAKQAGVGSGTLYRHFPNKDALLAALLDAHHEGLDRKRASIEAEVNDAGQALDHWIDALGDWMLGYDGLSDSLRAAWSRTNSPLTPTCENAVVTTEVFLRAAQDAGHAKATLSGRDIFLGALAVAWATGGSSPDEGTGKTLRDMLKSGWSSGRPAPAIPK